MLGIKGIEAMEFGSGVLSVEPPVDGGPGDVSLRDEGLDISPKGRFVGDALLEAAARQDAELDFRHPFDKLRTGFSQLPCFGV